MGRPADWSPLAGSDPVPGDPAEISAEAAHLQSVAEQIASQVAVLRKIASGQSDEKGQHAEKLKSAASDTADKLDKVTGRYRETAAALQAWVPELEHAQAQSLKALSQAQEAHGRQRASQPIQRPSGAKLTPADHAEDKARGQMLSQANNAMASAQAMLTAAVSHRDTAAAQTASRIRSAAGADADSAWDDFTSFLGSAWDWVKSNWVPWLKNFCTILEVIVTVLAFIALFIPGLDILAVLFILSVVALLGRTVLAATGNGSWLDVGMDVIGLLTMGMGTGILGGARMFWGATKALETATTSAEEIGKGLVETERAAKAAEYVTKYFGDTAGRFIGEGRAYEQAMKWATKVVPDLAEGGKAGYFSRLGHSLKAGGDFGDGANLAKLSRIAERFPDDPHLAAAMDQGKNALTGLRTASLANWGGALTGLAGGGGELDNAHGDSVLKLPDVKIGGHNFSSTWTSWDKAWDKAPLPGCKVASGGGG